MSAQFNLFTALACLTPVIATAAVGWFAIYQPVGGVETQTLLMTVTIAAAVVSVMAVAVAITRIRAITRNYVAVLNESCRQAIAGNRTLRVPVVGDDDYASFANTVNRMVTGGSIAAAAPSAKAGGASALEAPDAVVLQAQIEKLLTEVSAVGDGDLRVQAEVTPDTLGVLADSFNFMIEELAKVVGRVQATTNQVSTATRRLLDRSAEVAQSSEAQVRQITLASDRVAQLADFVQLSATNALQAAEAASEALQSSRDGQASVVKTTEGMAHIRENVQETSKKIKRLGERSQEVGEIVRLIEDIAEQTNLLALNAAIQSAMAGEHGRGFHVVADEIRILAERVAEATKRVGAIVKTIQGDTYEAVVAMEESTQEVIEGSRLADEAGRALQRIYGAVDRQAQMINDIAHGANERRQVAEAVAVAMVQIADVTKQTNSTTQDTMTSVSYLAELAEQLRASVAAFRLPEQLAEAAGMPQGMDSAPLSPTMTYQGQQGWAQQQDPFPGQQPWAPQQGAFPALPAGPISASYAPQANGFDFGTFDANWADAPQQEGFGFPPPAYPPAGFPPPAYPPTGYEQQGGGYAPDPYGQTGYGTEEYSSSPMGNFPFPPERG